MNRTGSVVEAREKVVSSVSGWPMLTLVIALIAGAIACFVAAAARSNEVYGVSGLVLLVAGLFLACGFFTLQPNEGRVLSA